MTVIATTRDASTPSPYDRAIGFTNAPATPVTKSTGSAARSTTTVANIIGPRVSDAASTIVRAVGRPLL